MATIEAGEFEGTRGLLVRCFEPVTKCVPSNPPYEREVLESAVAACPGASLRQVGYEHIPCPMDFGDERFDYLLEPTRPNVLALHATGFLWSDEALALVAGIEIVEEDAAGARRRAMAHLQGKQRDEAARLEPSWDRLPRHRETLPARPAPEGPPGGHPGPAAPPPSGREGPVRWIGGFLLECLGRALAFGLIVAVLFLPFGIVWAIGTRDPMALLMLPILGGVIGVLLGIGQVFIDRFSEPRPVEEGTESKPLGRSLLAFYLGPLAPSWWGVADLGRQILAKDYSKQKPGRRKRGLVGAVACMLIVGFLLGAVALTSPVSPAPGLAPAILIVLGLAGLAGGIAGALTDSR